MAEPIRYGGVIAGQDEIDAVTEVLRGQGWGSGALTVEFEREAAQAQGRQHALFVNSGSSALLLAMTTLPKGSVVAMPALQFPTLYSSAVWCGLRPVLVDCDDSLNMDPSALALSGPLDAVAFVHIAGNPTNVAEVAEVCGQRGIPLIEDACESFGGNLGSTQVGNFGAISCTSTHAAHAIATGEGGLVFCDDDDLHRRMRQLRDWGWDREAAQAGGYHYTYSELGFNLHASDIQAALGRVQLGRRFQFTIRRNGHYRYLRTALEDLPITLPRVAPNAWPSWFCFPLLCDRRDALRNHLAAAGIETRPILVGSLLRQPLGIEGPECPVADDVYRRGLWVSVHPRLTREDLERIVVAVRGFHAAG